MNEVYDSNMCAGEPGHDHCFVRHVRFRSQVHTTNVSTARASFFRVTQADP